MPTCTSGGPRTAPRPASRRSCRRKPTCRVEAARAVLDEHEVDRAVLVQPVFRGEDNNYVADCARAEPVRFAAVCVVDPRSPGADERLTRWVERRLSRPAAAPADCRGSRCVRRPLDLPALARRRAFESRRQRPG